MKNSKLLALEQSLDLDFKGKMNDLVSSVELNDMAENHHHLLRLAANSLDGDIVELRYLIEKQWLTYSRLNALIIIGSIGVNEASMNYAASVLLAKIVLAGMKNA